ncbi:hypothetical protein L6452_00109 [Arctium lappa]|uniref:Uncharacterized protein n=1 Tax=Arctium lappa TaxID=4217 RepID=A0ACB9FCE4_ARCLA|nr:hypothetical protein L6452_00109 [Arctium lappa]
MTAPSTQSKKKPGLNCEPGSVYDIKFGGGDCRERKNPWGLLLKDLHSSIENYTYRPIYIYKHTQSTKEVFLRAVY